MTWNKGSNEKPRSLQFPWDLQWGAVKWMEVGTNSSIFWHDNRNNKWMLRALGSDHLIIYGSSRHLDFAWIATVFGSNHSSFFWWQRWWHWWSWNVATSGPWGTHLSWTTSGRFRRGRLWTLMDSTDSKMDVWLLVDVIYLSHLIGHQFNLVKASELTRIVVFHTKFRLEIAYFRRDWSNMMQWVPGGERRRYDRLPLGQSLDSMLQHAPVEGYLSSSKGAGAFKEGGGGLVEGGGCSSCGGGFGLTKCSDSASQWCRHASIMFQDPPSCTRQCSQQVPKKEDFPLSFKKKEVRVAVSRILFVTS